MSAQPSLPLFNMTSQHDDDDGDALYWRMPRIMPRLAFSSCITLVAVGKSLRGLDWPVYRCGEGPNKVSFGRVCSHQSNIPCCCQRSCRNCRMILGAGIDPRNKRHGQGGGFIVPRTGSCDRYQCTKPSWRDAVFHSCSSQTR
jgi:hypothetical protein